MTAYMGTHRYSWLPPFVAAVHCAVLPYLSWIMSSGKRGRTPISLVTGDGEDDTMSNQAIPQNNPHAPTDSMEQTDEARFIEAEIARFLKQRFTLTL
jgi:hypothetical protein